MAEEQISRVLRSLDQKDYAHVVNTSICQDNSIVSQESSSSDVEMEVQSPQFMLQVGVLKPVNQTTPWINSFVLVEGKDKLGNLQLRMCLDPTNLNKAIVCELYHFKTPKDIAHHLAEACVITFCDCRKGYILAPSN